MVNIIIWLNVQAKVPYPFLYITVKVKKIFTDRTSYGVWETPEKPAVLANSKAEATSIMDSLLPC